MTAAVSVNAGLGNIGHFIFAEANSTNYRLVQAVSSDNNNNEVVTPPQPVKTDTAEALCAKTAGEIFFSVKKLQRPRRKDLISRCYEVAYSRSQRGGVRLG